MLLQLFSDSRDLLDGGKDAIAQTPTSSPMHPNASATTKGETESVPERTAALTDANSSGKRDVGTPCNEQLSNGIAAGAKGESATSRDKANGKKLAAEGSGVPPGTTSGESSKEGNGAFAQKVGVIFSAMYNVFVDAEVLGVVQSTAAKLATYATSHDTWASSEIGRYVHFIDDRGRERVRAIFETYADKGLKGKKPAAKVKRERAAFIAERIPVDSTRLSRTMGLASYRQGESLAAYTDMVNKCEWPQYYWIAAVDVCLALYCMSHVQGQDGIPRRVDVLVSGYWLSRAGHTPSRAVCTV